MNVSLTPTLEKYVRKKVASGLYNNASEVMREALRLLVDREEASGKGSDIETVKKDDVVAKLSALEKPLRKRGLISLSLFGSFVRDTARAESDVDLLIEVDHHRRFSLIDLVSVKNFLQEHLRRTVDIVTKDSLDPYIRDRVLSEAETVF